ncbi:MAG: hypothetical protein ACR2OG_07045 [Gemmatimonadaceae bacterium]
MHLAKKQRRPRREDPGGASLDGVGGVEVRDTTRRAEGNALGVLLLASRRLSLQMAHAPPFLS